MSPRTDNPGGGTRTHVIVPVHPAVFGVDDRRASRIERKSYCLVMEWTSVRIRALIATVLSAVLAGGCGSTPPAPEAERFVGTTPAGDEIRAMLGIPRDAPTEIIEWDLALHRDRYVLRLAHGATIANHPGLGSDAIKVERAGNWTASTGSGGRVLRLTGAVDLREVGPDVLAVLNPDSSLMVGDSGWSYTLNRAVRAERTVDPNLIPPDTSYAISPVASGPTVVGVFEGRTPCQGIAAEIGVDIRSRLCQGEVARHPVPAGG